MILKKQDSGFLYDPSILIPAVYENGQLVFKNNGISEIFFGKQEYTAYNHMNFQFFGMCTGPVQRPFFVLKYDNELQDYKKDLTDEEIINDYMVVFWELFNVYRKRTVEPNGDVKKKELQYTVLRHCRAGTVFCRCDDCGKHFVITPQVANFYIDRNLKVPGFRCPECIQKKRIRYATKNK